MIAKSLSLLRHLYRPWLQALILGVQHCICYGRHSVIPILKCHHKPCVVAKNTVFLTKMELLQLLRLLRSLMTRRFRFNLVTRVRQALTILCCK